MRKPLIHILIVLVLSQSYGVSQNSSITGEISEDRSKYTKITPGVLGTYANPPRFEDGRIDQKRLIWGNHGFAIITTNVTIIFTFTVNFRIVIVQVPST